MATAREVRAAVRAQLTEQMKARQDAALAVAAAWAKVGKAADRLAAAERDAADAVASATADVSVTDLAALTGIGEVELRRVLRTTKTGTRSTPDTPDPQTPGTENGDAALAQAPHTPAVTSPRGAPAAEPAALAG